MPYLWAGLGLRTAGQDYGRDEAAPRPGGNVQETFARDAM